MIENLGRKTACVGIVGQVDEPLQRDRSAVVLLFHLQEGFHSRPLILGQYGETLGKQIEVIQVDILSDHAALQALAADAGQFVFTGSAVLNSCLLECVVKFRPARRQLHNSGCFIPFGAAIADLHLENRLTQASSLPFGGSPPDIWLDRPPAHPSQPYSQLP